MALSKNAKIELLKQTALFARCTRADLLEVAINAEEREAAAGDALTEEGARSDEFFVLVDGHVAVRRSGRKVAELGPRDWFGEIAVLTYKPRTATVIATSPVRLLVLDAPSFRRAVDTRPRIALNVLRSVGHRLEKDARSRS